MTYHINVKRDSLKEFIQIIKTLRSLGVIESIDSTSDLIKEGEPLDEETLLNILDHSEKEINDGKSFTMEDVKNQIKNWKKR